MSAETIKKKKKNQLNYHPGTGNENYDDQPCEKRQKKYIYMNEIKKKKAMTIKSFCVIMFIKQHPSWINKAVNSSHMPRILSRYKLKIRG